MGTMTVEFESYGGKKERGEIVATVVLHDSHPISSLEPEQIHFVVVLPNGIFKTIHHRKCRRVGDNLYNNL